MNTKILKRALSPINWYLHYLIIGILAVSCANHSSSLYPVDEANISTPLTQETPVETTQSSNITLLDECIGTLNDFAFNFNYINNAPSSINKEYNFFSKEWQFVSQLPFDGEYSIIGSGSSENGKEIWLYYNELRQDPRYGKILLFYPSSDKLIEIPRRLDNGNLYVSGIYISQEGLVWGINSSLVPNINYPLISRLDREKNIFVLDDLSPAVFVDEILNTPRISKVMFSANNVVWFFVPDDGLYKYMLNTHELERSFSLPISLVHNSAIGSNGDIYFTNSDEDNQRMNIYRLSPEVSDIVIFTEIDRWQNRHPLFVDRGSNLWLGPALVIAPDRSISILYPEGYQEEVVRSVGSSYHGSPVIITESSNGLIWLRKNRMIDNGIAWYDPVTGNSCWFTDYFGNVVEDDSGNIWFEIDGGLFMYNHSP